MSLSLSPSKVLLAGLCAAVLGLQGCPVEDEPATVFPGSDSAAPPADAFLVGLPAAGDRLHLDTLYRFPWKARIPVPDGFIRVDLVRTGHPSRILGFTSQPDSGWFAWRPSEAGGAGSIGSGNGYRLRFAWRSDSTRAGVSPPFSIRSDIDGRLRVTAPYTGDTLVAGMPVLVRWTAEGRTGENVRLAWVLDKTVLGDIEPAVETSVGEVSWTVDACAATDARYRIRISSLADPALEELSPPFAIRGVASDSAEPDNRFQQVRTVPVDGTPQRRTLTRNDTDWIMIPTVPTRLYLITYRGVPELALLGPSLSGPGDLYALGAKAQLLIVAAGERLDFRVTSRGGGVGCGPYALSVHETSPRDPVYPARLLSPDSASRWTAGDSLEIRWTADSLVFGDSLDLFLVRAGAFPINIRENVPNAGSFRWTLPAEVPPGENYQVQLSSRLNGFVSVKGPPFHVIADSLR